MKTPLSNLRGPADEPAPSTDTEDDLRRLNDCYSTELIYVARCRFGLGIFARQKIAPGQRILTIEGPLIDFAETTRRGPRECMAIQIGPDLYFDTQPPGVWVNHSCEPNAGIRFDSQLTALRPIQAEEEICYDYSTTMEEASFTMSCRCGEPRCRGIVQDFSTLPPALRARYLSQGVVMSFIRSGAAVRLAPLHR
jgi:hypothetical protein